MNKNTVTRFAMLLTTVTLAGLSAFTTGCGAQGHVVYRPESGDQVARTTDKVEVLLDQAPERPFTVTGELTAQSFSNERSIDLLKQRAQEAGLDGIYWIDCTSHCSGRCSAKGFVYQDRVHKMTMDGTVIASEK